MFINLNNPGIGSDVDVNISTLLQKLLKKQELEKQLAEVQEGIDTFADRSFRMLKPKIPKAHERVYTMDLVILDKDGNAHNISLEEYYRDRDEDSEPSVLAKLESHQTL